MPDRVKRKTQVATNKNRQREPMFNTYLEFPLNIIEGDPGYLLLKLALCSSTLQVLTPTTVGFEPNGQKSNSIRHSSGPRSN